MTFNQIGLKYILKKAVSEILDVSTKTINRILENNPELVKPITKQKWRFDKNDPLFEKLR